MSLDDEDGARPVPLPAPQVCSVCGTRLHVTILGPRCPTHGMRWAA